MLTAPITQICQWLQIAQRAADNYKRWGRHASRRYAEREGVPLRIYADALMFKAGVSESWYELLLIDHDII